MYKFELLKDSYTELWNEAEVKSDKVASATKQAALILKYKNTYKETERLTGVPWWVVGIIHLREAGTQDVGRFECVLHNGEHIVGKEVKTRLVPAGRGPFTTWQDAAVDAIQMEGFDKISDWTVERVAYVFEKMNGFGYRTKGIPSPYLWGSTTVQQSGKFVADHVYDPNVMDTQIGAMAVLKELSKLENLYVGARGPVTKVSPAVNTGGAIIVGAGAAAVAAPDHVWWIIPAAAIAVAAIVLYFIIKNRKVT